MISLHKCCLIKNEDNIIHIILPYTSTKLADYIIIIKESLSLKML